MNRGQLDELHFITSLENVPSILEHGILSFYRARKIDHRSIAMTDVQERRERVRVPPGTPLHSFANLYINARNPMLYCRLPQHQEICVLRVSVDVLDLAGAVISDKNAASFTSGMPLFAAAPGGLKNVNYDRVFAEFWTHPGNPMEKIKHGHEMCAEVLIPNCVPPEHITGAYVSGAAAVHTFEALDCDLTADVNHRLFFNQPE